MTKNEHKVKLKKIVDEADYEYIDGKLVYAKLDNKDFVYLVKRAELANEQDKYSEKISLMQKEITRLERGKESLHDLLNDIERRAVHGKVM